MKYFHKEIELLYQSRDEIKQHFIGWGVYYLIDLAFILSVSENFNLTALIIYISTVFYYTSCFYSLTVVYKRLLPNKKLLTICIGLCILLGFSISKTFWDIHILENQKAIDRYSISSINHFTFELWRFSTSALYAFAYWIYLQSIKEHKLRLETEAQLNEAQIAFLKAQINPHFLFNTLNFVYSDVSAISITSGETILKLTKLLRYTVESTKSDSTSLKKEVDAISDYLQLQNLRFGGKTEVKFNKKGLLPFFAFPPLILLSLVENAFKYGIIDHPDHPIEITLEVNKERLYFRCMNLKRLDFIDKETTSVGLSNIKRRLEMAYGNDYNLLVNDNDSTYEVILTLNWNL